MKEIENLDRVSSVNAYFPLLLNLRLGSLCHFSRFLFIKGIVEQA